MEELKNTVIDIADTLKWGWKYDKMCRTLMILFAVATSLKIAHLVEVLAH